LAYKVPSVFADRSEFVLGYDSKNKFVREGTRSKLKVKQDLVSGSVGQVNQRPCGLVEDLEKVVTWPKSENGVQGGDIATPGRESEVVRVAVGDEGSL